MAQIEATISPLLFGGCFQAIPMRNGLSSSIAVEQVLHGYSDGHQQLAASVDLPRHVRTEMLMMSDLSGPGARDGFETYLTGYPLPEAGMYAFARTWYAAEMPRPGCVWTHTLLLREETLHALKRPSDLLPHFKRPTSGQSFDGYNESLLISCEFPRVENSGAETASALLEALYGCPGQTVAAGASNSSEWEWSVLAVWNQQWPELRRSFRFCTGCLAPRLVALVFVVF